MFAINKNKTKTVEESRKQEHQTSCKIPVAVEGILFNGWVDLN